MRSFLYTLVFMMAAGWVLSGCTTAPDVPAPRFVTLEFEAEGINTPIVQDSDTLRISEIKFLTQRFRIIDQDSLVLQSSDPIEPFLFVYNDSYTTPFVSLDVQLQFDDIAPINAYEMEFLPLRPGDPVLDDDFRGVDETFSLVLKGVINRRDFIYQSDLSFDKSVAFDPAVELTDDKSILLIAKSIDLEAMFRNPEGGFYSPDNEEDMQLVEQAFQEMLEIRAQAINR